MGKSGAALALQGTRITGYWMYVTSAGTDVRVAHIARLRASAHVVLAKLAPTGITTPPFGTVWLVPGVTLGCILNKYVIFTGTPPVQGACWAQL